MEVKRWLVYYNDREEPFTSDDFKPSEIPIDGVLWIVEELERGRRFCHGHDYYRWTGDSWSGGTRADLDRWLRLREEPLIVLFGLWISDRKYKKLEEKIMNEDCTGCS